MLPWQRGCVPIGGGRGHHEWWRGKGVKFGELLRWPCAKGLHDYHYCLLLVYHYCLFIITCLSFLFITCLSLFVYHYCLLLDYHYCLFIIIYLSLLFITCLSLLFITCLSLLFITCLSLLFITCLSLLFIYHYCLLLVYHSCLFIITCLIIPVYYVFYFTFTNHRCRIIQQRSQGRRLLVSIPRSCLMPLPPRPPPPHIPPSQPTRSAGRGPSWIRTRPPTVAMPTYRGVLSSVRRQRSEFKPRGISSGRGRWTALTSMGRRVQCEGVVCEGVRMGRVWCVRMGRNPPIK